MNVMMEGAADVQEDFPAVGSNSPYMSFDDIYQVSRPDSSFEEFWERHRTGSVSSSQNLEIRSIPSLSERRRVFSSPRLSSFSSQHTSLRVTSSLSTMSRIPSLTSGRSRSDTNNGNRDLSRDSIARQLSRRISRRVSAMGQFMKELKPADEKN